MGVSLRYCWVVRWRCVGESGFGGREVDEWEGAVVPDCADAEREGINAGVGAIGAVDNKQGVMGEVHARGHGAPHAGEVTSTVGIDICIEDESNAECAPARLLGSAGGI